MFDGFIFDSYVMEQEVWYLHRHLLEDVDMKSIKDMIGDPFLDLGKLGSQPDYILVDVNQRRWGHAEEKFLRNVDFEGT